jgi:hypothetical protein
MVVDDVLHTYILSLMTGKKVFSRKADLQEIIEHFNVCFLSAMALFL